MSNSITGRSITQHGIQTPRSNTILIVTPGRATPGRVCSPADPSR